MSDKIIGVVVAGRNTDEIIGRIERSEGAGIPAVWMTTGGARLDSITTIAAAATRTREIKFGTSVVPTFPRHPLVMVQQAQVVAQLAPGRFRLGIVFRDRHAREGNNARECLGILARHQRELLFHAQQLHVALLGGEEQLGPARAEPC